jgi:type VI secretion system protein ImpB
MPLPHSMNNPHSSQKLIARNRAPRVQIEYDVEIYGSEKKVELPFVMGVLADLSGKPVEPLAAVADRRFLDIDIDNFDERMKAIKPRAAFAVSNTLSGEGQLLVDMTFESIEDFSPAAVARKVEPLRRLLDARTQLANLQTYMDGKSGAEALVNKLLADPELLKKLAVHLVQQADQEQVDPDSVESPR